jgi:uncharacterized protein RhaS with RHS repeats
MQARYYDPVIGRFYSNDPIGFRDIHSFNRYAYANNNPYKYVDPDGMQADLAESNRRHEKAVQMHVGRLRKQGFTNFGYDVRIKVNTGDGDSAIRVVDIAAMKPGQNLGSAELHEIKTVQAKGGKGASLLRKANRIGSAVEVISKISRGATAINQMRKDIALNELGGVVQRTGETLNSGTMNWSIYEHNGAKMKRKGPAFPIVRGGNVAKEFKKQFID